MRYSSLIILLALLSCASNKRVDTKSDAEKKAEIYYNQGTQELVTNEYTQALKHLLEANTLNPNSSKIQNNLGMAYYFKKKPHRAVRFIKHAIKNDPKNTEARLNLATIYVRLEKIKEAKRQYDIVLDDLTYSGQYKTYYNLGILSLKQKREAQAINYFKQSLNENQSYCPAHFQLGNIHFKNGQYQESLISYKKASIGTCYNNPGPIYQQALSLIELKEYSTAKLKLEEVVERFALTKYQKLADRKLKNLDQQAIEKQLGSDFEENSNGKIFTPSF